MDCIVDSLDCHNRRRLQRILHRYAHGPDDDTHGVDTG